MARRQDVAFQGDPVAVRRPAGDLPDRAHHALILDLALALAEDRRRDIIRKTRDGFDAARARGRTGGRPRVVDTDKRRIILARHTDGESIRTIARATRVSVGTVHKVLANHRGSRD